MLGVAADAMNPAGRVDPQHPLLAPFGLVRLVAFEDPAFYEYCYELQAAGYGLALVLARESFPGDQISEQQIRTYLERLAPQYVVVGNEVDAGLILDPSTGEPVDSPSSWKMTARVYSDFVRMAYPTIRECRPEARIVGAGLISGQVWWFNEYDGPDLDAWDLHSYGDPTPSETRQYIRSYRAAAGCPIVMFEWARSPELIAPTLAVIQRETIANCWFCWSDGMVPPLGLLDVEGNPKPEYDALVQAASVPPTEDYMGKIEELAASESLLAGPLWRPNDLPIEEIQTTRGGIIRWAWCANGITAEAPTGETWSPVEATPASFIAVLQAVATAMPNELASVLESLGFRRLPV